MAQDQSTNKCPRRDGVVRQSDILFGHSYHKKDGSAHQTPLVSCVANWPLQSPKKTQCGLDKCALLYESRKPRSRESSVTDDARAAAAVSWSNSETPTIPRSPLPSYRRTEPPASSTMMWVAHVSHSLRMPGDGGGGGVDKGKA